MAVHTLLKKDEISKFLKNYRLESFQSFKGINEGIENTNYLLKTKNKNYILTLYEKRIKKSDLPFYLSLMTHSKRNGISCPVPILSKSRESILELKKKKISLFTFLKGKCLKNWNENHCFKIGKVLGEFHLANKNFVKKKKNDYSIESWTKLYTKCKNDMELISPGSKSILENELLFLKKNWPKNLPKGIIHADLFPDNILFMKNDICGVLDFYFSCNDFFVYDLAITLNAWSFEKNIFNVKLFMSLIKGYQDVRKLTTNEKKSLNICLRGSCVRFFFTRMYDTIFSKQKKIYRNKHPNEYLKKLIFHRKNTFIKEYTFE